MTNPDAAGLGSRVCAGVRVILLALLGLSAPLSVAQDADEGSVFEAGKIYLEADDVFELQDPPRLVAQGSVVGRYENRVLRANELIYFTETDRVVARGDVEIIEPDGDVVYAEEAEFDGDFNNGVVKQFSARLANDAALGAAISVRREGRVNEYRRGFYTACKLCKRPLWQIKARRVIQNEEDQTVYYQDARLEVKGVPIFYTPFFFHPDPQATRRSGLLAPNVGAFGGVGFFFEQPVFFALDDHTNLTVAARINQRVAPLGRLSFLRRFHSGVVQWDASITRETEFTNEGEPFGPEQVRFNSFASGRFRIADDWIWGFGHERLSDDLFLRRNGLRDDPRRRGPLPPDRTRLINQVYLDGQGDNYFVRLLSANFQGLRALDIDDQIPLVTPLIDARVVFDDPFFGGRFELLGSSAVLTRIDGVDSARATAGASWRRRMVLPLGIETTAFADGRVDFFALDDLNAAVDVDPTTFDPLDDDERLARVLGTFGLEVRWPFARFGERVNWIVEPIIQAAYSPRGGSDDSIPNEDSLLVEFDEFNLFEVNRFAGFDRFEEGFRANVGGRITANWGREGQAVAQFGQVYRAQEDAELAAATVGFDGNFSDFVLGLQIQPNNNIRFGARTQFNDETLARERTVLTSDLSAGRFSLFTEYAFFATPLPTDRPNEALNWSLLSDITDQISVGYAGQFDIEANDLRRQRAVLRYENCCVTLLFNVNLDRTFDRSQGPTEAFGFRLNLRTLGGIGG